MRCSLHILEPYLQTYYKLSQPFTIASRALRGTVLEVPVSASLCRKSAAPKREKPREGRCELAGAQKILHSYAVLQPRFQLLLFAGPRKTAVRDVSLYKHPVDC